MRDWVKYFDMLIEQSELNEVKAGSSADSVADKIRDIQSQLLFSLKLEELVKAEENRMGRLLVDLQNGWSKDGKKNMEMIRAKLQSLLEAAKT